MMFILHTVLAHNKGIFIQAFCKAQTKAGSCLSPQNLPSNYNPLQDRTSNKIYSEFGLHVNQKADSFAESALSLDK